MHKDTTKRDQTVLISVLFILYSLFVLTAFIKSDHLWGINYLYYLPGWIKLIFIVLGGIVFLPPVNNDLFKIYERIADLIFNRCNFKHNKSLQILYLIILSSFFAGLFYYFRVVSLYHCPMGAVY